MNATTTFDPLVSEFETQEQANSYDRWFQREVQEAIDSKKPRIPHDQVMAQMWEAIDQRIPKAPHLIRPAAVPRVVEWQR